MAKPYERLKKALHQNDLTQYSVKLRLNRSQAYMSSRWSGKLPWEQDEMYALMDMINAPYSKLHEYFPLHGLEKNLHLESEPAFRTLEGLAVKANVDKDGRVSLVLA